MGGKLWENAANLQQDLLKALMVYWKLNHLMMEGEGFSVPSEYAKPNNVPFYVSDAIKKWIENLPR